MDKKNDIEPGGHDPESGKPGMETSDKVVLIAAAIIFGGLFILAALLLEGVIVGVTGIVGGIGAGIGILGALPIAIALSIALMVLFGLVAGDAVGELPTMLAGFFLMTAFFTVVIAVIY